MILVHCYLIKYISFFGTRLFSSSSSRFLYYPAKEAHVLYVAFSFFAITMCECTCPRFVSEKKSRDYLCYLLLHPQPLWQHLLRFLVLEPVRLSSLGDPLDDLLQPRHSPLLQFAKDEIPVVINLKRPGVPKILFQHVPEKVNGQHRVHLIRFHGRHPLRDWRSSR
jgi:hypothetical protein